MKIWHGTTVESAEVIEEEGFMGSFLKKTTDGFSTTGSCLDGFVFFAPDIEEARGYGEAIFEVELSDKEFEKFFFQKSRETDAIEIAIPVEIVNYTLGFVRVK